MPIFKKVIHILIFKIHLGHTSRPVVEIARCEGGTEIWCTVRKSAWT